jgi:hypothetical protein
MNQKFINMPKRQLSVRERQIRRDYIILGAVAILLTVGISLFHSNRQSIQIQHLSKELDSLSILTDSLRDENFNSSVENGRYELSLDHLKEVNPKAAQQFEDYLEHETE